MKTNFISQVIISVAKVFIYINGLFTKFMYLYLMDEYKKTDYRNFVAGKIRELESQERTGVEAEQFKLAIVPLKELYVWMCTN